MDNTSVSDQIIAGYYDSNLYGVWGIDYKLRAYLEVRDR